MPSKQKKVSTKSTKVVKKKTAPVKKTGSKKSVSKKTVTKKTVSKKTVTKKPVTKKTVSKKTTGKKAATKKTVAKKTVAKKTVAKSASTPAAAATTTETKQRKIRSFKVLLPGSEEYTGRFTGLTPYQAANKALSKYYRENKGKTAQISFTIKESTRASKRNVYPYEGKRIKLETPIEYTINGGKTIVKRFKNKLKKIKKNAQASK